jgi:hypothetical protein
MDLASWEDPFSSDYNDESVLFTDPTLSGDSEIDWSLVLNFSAPVPNEGANIEEFIPQPSLGCSETSQSMPSPIDISTSENIRLALEAPDEIPGVDLSPSLWNASPDSLHPLGYSLPITPLDLIYHQSPEISSQLGCSISPTPEAPNYQQTSFIQHQIMQQRRRNNKKNPESLQRNQRKRNKPEKCHMCGKGHAYKRDLNRHMVSNHKAEAERLGLDVSKIECKICKKVFDRIRSDRLLKHMKKIH